MHPVPVRPKYRSVVTLGATILLAVLWGAYPTWLQMSRRAEISANLFFPLPPGMAPGPRATLPPAFLDESGADGYTWIRFAQAMSEKGIWRLRDTTIDNAPDGREVHWSSSFAWALIAAGWLNHLITGESLPNSIPSAAEWINPALLISFLIGFPILASIRWGTVGAVTAAITTLGMPGFTGGFDYPDHHGIHNIAYALAVFFLLTAGLGWVGTKSDPAPGSPPPLETARAGFLGSAIACTIGLWVSAIATSIFLMGIGIGAVAAFIAFRKKHADGSHTVQPELWRLWGLAGGGGSLFFYLLEYAPSHFGMRLEVNHPLYAIAWIGGGEILCRLQSGLVLHRWPRSGADQTIGLLALLAVAALPGAILIGGSAWYAPLDPFLAKLHTLISEFVPLSFRVKYYPLGVVTQWYWAPISMMAVLLALPFLRWISVWRRRLILFGAVSAFIGFLLFTHQIRWGMVQCSVLVGISPILGSALWEPLRSPLATRWLRAGFSLYLLSILLLDPTARWMKAWRNVMEKRTSVTQAQQLLQRDMAQFLRASVGAKTPVILFASPDSSTLMGYLGNFQTLGTLYWENHEGLKKFARIISSSTDEEALAVIERYGVTHLAFVKTNNFIENAYLLTHPDARPEDWMQSFGWRVFLSGRIPSWLKTLPYRQPDAFKDFKENPLLFEVAPSQTAAEAAFHLGNFFLINGQFDKAARLLGSAASQLSNVPEVRIKLGEALIAVKDVGGGKGEIEAGIDLAPEGQRSQLAFEAAFLMAEKNEPESALDFIKKATSAAWSDPLALTRISWALATSKLDAMRNGVEATRIATRAVEMAPDRALARLSLAAANAESGNYASAASTASEAIRMAKMARETELVDQGSRQLASYQQGLPWRQ